MKCIKKTFANKPMITVAAIVLLASVQQANAVESITDALTGGKSTVNLQYRYEGVQQNNALQNAVASTLRLRFGYETASFYSLSAMVEAETVQSLGNQNYDSKANGKTNYSVVADPVATEMNQAYLSYAGLPSTKLKWGRQRLILDNARFIGNVGWRQNEQTFDALTVVNESLPDTKITAGYITNVNRVFSDNALAASGAAAGNHKMHSPIINVNYKGLPFGELVGYGYFLDYDTPVANYSNSSKTYGVRLNGATQVGESKLLYTAEYANQSNYKRNPATYNNSYALLELGMSNTLGNLKAGYEVLGSNGVKSFSTPLATLHAFNGWTDTFLATPATGLKDAYVAAGSVLGGVKVGAIYHDFRADSGGGNFGAEWDMVASKSFNKNYLVGAKYGRFSTKSVAYVDTNKFWLWAEAKF